MGVQIRELENTGVAGSKVITKTGGIWGVNQTYILSNIAWVDPNNGVNSTAEVGVVDQPFKDPWAARDAIESLSSDVSYTVIWLSGEYTVGDDAGNLKVIASPGDGNLHSDTHDIIHYLHKGAKLQAVSDAIQFNIFELGSQGKATILGNGTLIHDNGTATGCKLYNDTSLTAGQTGEIEIEADLIDITKGSGTAFNYISVNRQGGVKIKASVNVNDYKLVQFTPNATVTALDTYLDLNIKELAGTQNDLIFCQGLDDGSRGFSSTNINIQIDKAYLIGTGSIVNFYRTLWDTCNVFIEINNVEISRSGVNSSLVRLNEGLTLDSNFNIEINNCITDTDYLIDLNLTSSNLDPHDDNDANVNIVLNNIKYNLNGSYVDEALVKYNYFDDVPGLKVNLNINGEFEDRVISKFRNSQDLTIRGNIRTTGTTEPFLITEVLTQSATANYDFKVHLKDLYVETPDSVDVINVNGFTGSEILTSNYFDRTTVNIETL